MKEDYIKTNVPALDRSVIILNYVSSCDSPPLAADITRDLELPRSSAHAVISALVAHGLLHKNNELRYTISGAVMQWANSFLTQQNVVSLFSTEIVTQPELSSYSLTLTCRDDDNVICLACHNGNSRLGFTFHMGLRLPVFFAATGKAILSTEDDDHLQELFIANRGQPLTPQSTNDVDTFMKSIHKTRERGYSIDDREIRDGMFCIGVPVFDHSQTARYGIALSMQKTEACDDTVARIGKTLRAYADSLSLRLGASREKHNVK